MVENNDENVKCLQSDDVELNFEGFILFVTFLIMENGGEIKVIKDNKISVTLENNVYNIEFSQ